MRGLRFCCIPLLQCVKALGHWLDASQQRLDAPIYCGDEEWR